MSLEILTLSHSKKTLPGYVNPMKIVIPKEDIARLYLEGFTMEEIAQQLGTTKRVIHLRMQEYDIPRRKMVGKHHGSWKGGKVMKSGYPATYNPTHPRTSNVGYVFDHVLEVEKAIGRVPTRKEPIHHIDFDRSNCELSNLHLCASHSEHGRIHASLEGLATALFRSGVIGFSVEDVGYYLV